MNFIRRYPVSSFIILALIITYIMGLGFFILLTSILGLEIGGLSEIIMKFGPSLAGITIISILYGKAGLKSIFLRCTELRLSIWWYLLALFLPPLISAVVLYFTGNRAAFYSLDLFSIVKVFFYQLLLAVFLGGGLGEELGWRGFMFPKLFEKYSVFTSGVLVGTAWFVWHIPAYIFFNKGENDPVIPFLIICISVSLILARFYFYTNRSLLIPIIVHGSMNAVFYSMEELMNDILNSPGFQPEFDWAVSLAWLAAALTMQLKLKFTKD